MSGKPDTGPVCRVFETPAVLSSAAADLVADRAGAAIARRGRFVLVLSGGTTPQGLYRLLAGARGGRSVDWSRVVFFFGDERCVHPDHPESNYGMARDGLLAPLAVPADRIYRIPAENGPERGAYLYNEALAAFFGRHEAPRFDLCLLGLGADGHTASLFPGSGALDAPGPAAPVHRPLRDRPDRVTLTLSAINASRFVLFLVSGREKAAMAGRLCGGQARDLPAGRVRPTGGVLRIFLDRDAAGAQDNVRDAMP